MTHGKSGLLYACGGSEESQADSCKINDILYILGQELPYHIPKVSIIISEERVMVPYNLAYMHIVLSVIKYIEHCGYT